MKLVFPSDSDVRIAPLTLLVYRYPKNGLPIVETAAWDGKDAEAPAEEEPQEDNEDREL